MKKVKLEKISKSISSGITPLRSNLEYWDDGNIPWLKTEQLGEKYIYDTSEKITDYALENTTIKLNPINTLCIAMYGEGRTRGNISILKSIMTTNQACCNIVIDEDKADYEYIYYYLKTQYHQLRSLSSGVRKNLNSNDIKNFEIRLPKDIITQKKIAAVLSSLDDKIELNNRINSELENLAKTIYDYWFVQFDFPDENGKPYKSCGGKMVYNQELKREIPAGWEVGTLSKLGDIAGGSTPSTKNPLNFCHNGTAWITPKDLSLNVGNKFISRGELDVTDAGIKEASLKIYPKGTILLSSRAPIGYMAVARNEVTTNQGFKSFIPNKRFSIPFVYYTVKNSMNAIIKQASGSTFKEVSLTTLKDNVYICLPSNTVVDFYTKKVNSIFKQQDILEQENQQLTQLRDWLLPMLMNGQITVK
ncbi:MAG: restriction endonuclease subunit S [Microcystis panniformis]